MNPNDLLASARASARARREESGRITCPERIAALPRQDFSKVPGLVEKWTEALRRTPNARPLRPKQAEVLEVFDWMVRNTEAGGLFGNLAVGAGKTLLFFLLPMLMGAERPVLLLDPAMRTQYQADLFEWSQEYAFTPATVVYYSELSRPEGTDLLRKLNPDLIMADEAQNLKNPEAARTKRFMRYMDEAPWTRFAAMSGTLTTTSLMDYAHLVVLALRELAPVPLDHTTCVLFDSVLGSDIDSSPDDAAWRAVNFLDPRAARLRDRDLIRMAFNERLWSAPGTVNTHVSSCNSQLLLTAVYPPLSQEVLDAVNLAITDFELPNGEYIIDALQAHSATTQLSSGFYYRWAWPGDEEDEEWTEARRAWAREANTYLKYRAQEGRDSPWLLEQHLLRVGRSHAPSAYDALVAWMNQRHKPEPPVEAVWLDESVVDWAVDWLASREAGFLWFHSRAVGEKLAEYGVPVFWEGMPDREKTPLCALSIPVYHKGMNFQAWDDQCVLEPMPNAARWEQLLGRQHRAGQLSPMVKCSVAQHTWPIQERMKKAFARSRYIEQTTSQPQKLLLARKSGFRFDP